MEPFIPILVQNIKLKDLLSELGIRIPVGFPILEPYDLELRDVSMPNPSNPPPYVVTGNLQDYPQLRFGLIKPDQEEEHFAFAVNFRRSMNLSQMKLFGKSIPALQSIGVHLEGMAYVHLGLTTVLKSTVDSWNTLLRENIFPARVLQPGLRIYGRTELFGQTKPWDILLYDPNRVESGLAPDETEIHYRTDIWFPVQQTLGPLTIRRIGIGMSGTDFRFDTRIDGLVSLFGVELELLDLHASVPFISGPDVATLLQGMDLTYDLDPMKISGGLLMESENKFGGSASIETLKRSIDAIGQYEQIDGEDSLFVYASLDQHLGGPPYMYVTGISLGFGINRRFKEPTVEEVNVVPLMDRDDQMNRVLTKLKQWIVAETGSNWLAVGLDFNTFELIESKMLLIGQMSKELELILLGKSTLDLPKKSGHDNKFVHVEALLKGVWKPSQGFAGISSTLTEDSFLFSKNCKLGGDFAAWFWYGENFNGDFAISLGGYHPKFQVPSHYPRLDRLSLNWDIGGFVLKGSSYFAITPACTMGGGSFELAYDKNNVYLGFIAYADFLLEWKPFYVDAAVGVTVRGQVKTKVKGVLKWFERFLKIEFGTTFELWGPPTGGKVLLDCFACTIPISFGERKKQQHQLLDEKSETEFMKMLPDPDHPLRIHASSGLIGKMPTTSIDDPDTWKIGADQFSFAIESEFPFKYCKVLDLNGNQEEWNVLLDEDESEYRGLSIRLLGEKITYAALSLSLRHNEMGAVKLDAELVRKGIPKAMWWIEPTLFRPSAPHEETIPECVGIDASPVKPTSTYRGDIEFDSKYKRERVELMDVPPTEGSKIQGNSQTSPNARNIIMNTINEAGVLRERDNLIRYLTEAGLYSGDNDSMFQLSQNADWLYIEPPLIWEAVPIGGGTI
ncbi:MULTISPECIES: DUF6603 domain-containing protein [unclassified Paenibacillus]|uniref:DUF6603 domain-containing protein n=1 Tax=unclassified Paenibacillus TaxID=185978 RepID=UPI002784C781|nr:MULTISPECIES: DUF6603 domain-containing protein [unclassified Paenibacillus]MDQ0896368.1 hypothetical protein [Paenibacillus sp. V4I7]MDQ0914088.1 hypothetical protein [Paenibacillus sp. V4I5]